MHTTSSLRRQMEMQWSGPAQVMAQASLGSRDSTRLWEEAQASRFEHCSSSQCICTDRLALWHARETFWISNIWTLSSKSMCRHFESMHMCTVQISCPNGHWLVISSGGSACSQYTGSFSKPWWCLVGITPALNRGHARFDCFQCLRKESEEMNCRVKGL